MREKKRKNDMTVDCANQLIIPLHRLVVLGHCLDAWSIISSLDSWSIISSLDAWRRSYTLSVRHFLSNLSTDLYSDLHVNTTQSTSHCILI